MTGRVLDHKIVSDGEWVEARLALLQKEKELTRLHDEVARERLKLPWERVTKQYEFDGNAGRETLSDLFAGRGQLAIYHFMLGPGWEEGCKSCSFLADHFDGMTIHLAHRDLTMIAVSRAPYEEIAKFQRRMGWKFKWVSSFGSTFNFDYGVSFTKEQLEQKRIYYNYEMSANGQEESPGASFFYKGADGEVFHTYSTYARGLDALLGTYQILDMAPKGRDEDGLKFTMAWVRHHDRYDDEYRVDPAAGYEPPKVVSGGGCCKGE